MLLIVFPVIFLSLLELSALVTGNYSWLFAFGALIVSLIGVWRVSKKKIALPIVFFLSLLPILFLGISRNFLFAQLITAVVSVLFYLILLSFTRRLFLPIIFSSFIIFLAGIFLMLVYQVSAVVSWPLISLFIFSMSSLLFFSSIYLFIENNPRPLLRLLCFSSVVGFVIVEFYYALFASPLNFASIDFLVFIIYYGLWDLARRYFSQRLTKKSLILNVCAIFISFIVVFLSAKWFP